MKTKPPRCAYRVFTGERSDFGGHPCLSGATVQENGKGWCRTHAPSAAAARRKASEERWAAERRRQDAMYAVERIENDIIAHVREWEQPEGSALARLRADLLAADEKARAT